MPLPVVRPGQTHPAVVKLKQAVVQALKQRNHDQLAGSINQRSRTYGRSAVRAVKVFQRDKQLQADGVVGARTWHALGFKDQVVDTHPPALNGIPYEPGLIAIDGRWVDKPLGEQLLAERKAGRWRGVVNSGYRPPWYQKRLWDAAVRKYGSEQAASKWVARPGTSRHGRKGGQGAVDVSLGEQLDASTDRLYRPMSWEPWHVQLAGTREMPGDENEPPPDARGMDVSEADLESQGVTMADVDASVEELLQDMDRPNDQMSEDDEDSIDDGYDPEVQRTRTTEGVPG
jgi:Putative peptidoglycan binding domain/D-alanyl-D-alanine carboxypeptidase